MTIKQTRFALGIITLSSIGAFVSPAVRPQLGQGSRQRQQVQTANLTGAWTLNEDLSDDPAKAMKELEYMQAERHGGGGSGGHGPWMHGGGGGMGGAKDMEEMRVRMNRVLEPPGRLTIAQAGSSITFTDGGGRSQTLTTNNKKKKVPLNDRTAEVRAKWDGGRLVKETSLGDGMKLTETYTVVSEPPQLHVLVKLDISHMPQPVNLRRVYDAESRR
ncbi:MAG TPA: hypothetical protein VGX68_10585 [Thermoanaerobaculia bacterium]|nr:hypothetical protein [Thermoanaerobaculia bacterium]